MPYPKKNYDKRSCLRLMKRKKVLISAYDCHPSRGSEWAVSWQWALEMSKLYDVWVVTRSDQRKDIEIALAKGPSSLPKFIFVDQFFSINWRSDQAPYFILLLGYKLWQYKAYRVIKRVHEREKFDLIHHLSWAGISAGGHLWKLGVPFLIGPAAGAQVAPLRFLPTFGRFFSSELVRCLLVALQRVDPTTRALLRTSSTVLVCNTETARRARLLGGREVKLFPVIGVTTVLEETPKEQRDQIPLILMVGRFHPQKGHMLGLRAFAELIRRGVRARLVICGKGPLHKKYQRYIRRHRLEQSVTITGWLSQVELRRYYEHGDIFLFPSIREPFGIVMLEAMVHGLPIVCLDHQAARHVVHSKIGIKVPVTHPSAVISGLASAMEVLVTQPEVRRKMGMAAKAIAKELYSWDSLRARMAQVYESAMHSQEHDALQTFTLSRTEGA